MTEEIYEIGGMHCAACSSAVERVTRKLPGVERSEVNLPMNRLTIAYSLPKKWLQPIGISSVRVNVTGTNLFDFYNPYPDNFMSTLAGSYGNYPNLRNWTIGLNVNF